jgi:hypothetical protein
MADNIYDKKVGDTLTKEQMVQAAVGTTSAIDVPADATAAEEADYEAYNGGALFYPIDLNGRNHVGIIRFSARKLPPIEYAELTTDLAGWIQKTTAAGLEAVGATATSDLVSSIGKSEDEIAEENRQKDDKEAAKNTINKDAADFKKSYNSGATRTLDILSEGDPVGSTTLYMPKDLRFYDAMNYSTSDLGIIGGTVEAAMMSKRGSSFGAAAMGGISTELSMLMGGGSGAARNAATLGVLRAAKAIKSGIGDIGGALGSSIAGATSAARVTSNPNTRNIFESIQMRNFSFTFKLIATSQKEANEITNIIKFFRSNMYPASFSMAGSNIPLGYIFPNIFDIEIQYNNKTVGTKILPSYLRDLNVSYNGTGQGLHADGNVVETDITLTFGEAFNLDRQLIVRGGY